MESRECVGEREREKSTYISECVCFAALIKRWDAMLLNRHFNWPR